MKKIINLMCTALAVLAMTAVMSCNTGAVEEEDLTDLETLSSVSEIVWQAGDYNSYIESTYVDSATNVKTIYAVTGILTLNGTESTSTTDYTVDETGTMKKVYPDEASYSEAKESAGATATCDDATWTISKPMYVGSNTSEGTLGDIAGGSFTLIQQSKDKKTIVLTGPGDGGSTTVMTLTVKA